MVEPEVFSDTTSMLRTSKQVVKIKILVALLEWLESPFTQAFSFTSSGLTLTALNITINNDISFEE